MHSLSLRSASGFGGCVSGISSILSKYISNWPNSGRNMYFFNGALNYYDSGLSVNNDPSIKTLKACCTACNYI
uniref:Uncharacterized protein n=1 Tax=Anguilla anguilla TaxID=7936 RepID=A0A0E9P621_ANGAN